MEPEIVAGDNILVNKSIPGARIFNFFNNKNKRSIRRLPGYRKIKHNDIVVFHFPHPNTWNKLEMDILQYYIKRCIALPGDTISIKNGYYKIERHMNVIGDLNSQTKLSKTPINFIEDVVMRTLPFDSLTDWNIKNFGPYFIPKKKSTIELNPLNYLLYKKVIEWEQEGVLLSTEEGYLLNGNPIKTYTFLNNYYFMGGDNVLDSQDSRYWGLLPEEYIVGKAFLIWKSVNPYTGKYEWGRFFKKIH